METKFLFPYEYVDKGSRLIIYGLGICGNSYVQQLELTKYAKIVGVTDSYVKNEVDNYRFLSQDYLVKHASEYDYIVIAMTKYTMAYEVYSSLLKSGIRKEKLISPIFREGGFNQKKEFLNNNEEDRIYVVITMAGGLGDAIMELCLYERLIEMSPNIVIDIFGEPYCKYIYDGKRNIRKIIDYNKEKISLEDYDIALQASWGITIQKAHYEKIEKISHELSECLRKTYMDMRKGESLVIRIRKAQIMHKDKFWLMGRGDIWNLSKEKIRVDLKEEYSNTFSEMNLCKYITINCGADMRRINKGQSPTKVWPRKHFERFISLFKDEYKDVEVIQLGDKNQETIPGVDRGVFGKSFELVKYIIKNSLLHIDDEGGLVHLATALGTKCIVLFGPTPSDILGYPQNINICVNICPGCFAYTNDWNANCLLGDKETRCMSAISPESVIEKVQGLFQ